LAIGAGFGPGWPLASNIAALGFANGLFAVSAIGMMMSLAGSGTGTQEGVRMGVWGAAQAIAFGLGGLTGALGVDLARRARHVDRRRLDRRHRVRQAGHGIVDAGGELAE
jgi:BCD family chlorophyll transporter-like MFS transporter